MSLPRHVWKSLLAGALLLVPALPRGGQEESAAVGSPELASLRRQIRELEESLAALAERRRDLAGRLETIELELKLQDRRVAEAVEQRRLAEQAVRQLAGEMESLEDRLLVARQSLRRRVVGLYRLGRQGYLRLLLAARPGAELWAAVRSVRFLARRDQQSIAEYEGLNEELRGRRESLAARERETQRWAEEARQRSAALAAARREHQVLLAEAERERLVVAGRAVDLAEREQRLSTLLNELTTSGAAPLAGAAIQEFRGALEWPVVGRVSLGFGLRRDPRYGTTVPHRGIEIELDTASTVRAVYPGKVVYAAVLEGYGETVVIQHAGRVFSLYSGLDRLGAKRGDVVSLGAFLGAAKGRLYFEIRVENRPEDPLGWLRSGAAAQPPPSELGTQP